jgi:hypothetical protein
LTHPLPTKEKLIESDEKRPITASVSRKNTAEIKKDETKTEVKSKQLGYLKATINSDNRSALNL